MKMIPDFGMDAETADTQIDLIRDARETLALSRETLEHLAEGQTPVVWTADGKSVDLAGALAAKYQAAMAWRDSIEHALDAAETNLLKAIDATNQLDADQKAAYRNLLYRTVGTVDKPIAV